jgi:chaperonin cofactor prefoldin
MGCCNGQSKATNRCCCDSTQQSKIDALAQRVSTLETAVATLAARDVILEDRIEEVVSAIEDGSEASISGSASAS